MLKKNIFLVIVSFLAFSLDRFTKIYFLHKASNPLVIIDNLLILGLHKNKGMAFGLLINSYIYYIFIIIIFGILFYLLFDNIKQKVFYLICCLLFIIIGAFSNLIDRIRFGAVIDFINVPFWSIFNLADCFIVGGVIFWLIYLFRHEEISKKS